MFERKPAEAAPVKSAAPPKQQESDKESNYDDDWDLGADGLFGADKSAEAANAVVAAARKEASPIMAKVEEKVKEAPVQIDFFGTDAHDQADNIPELKPVQKVSEPEKHSAPQGPSEQEKSANNDKSLDLLGGIEAAAQFEDNASDGGDMLQDELAALEREFSGKVDNRGANPFGQSITKELLIKSKKELGDALFSQDNDVLDDLNDQESDRSLQDGKDKNNQKINQPATVATKNLEIEIDENLDFEQQNEAAQ